MGGRSTVDYEFQISSSLGSYSVSSLNETMKTLSSSDFVVTDIRFEPQVSTMTQNFFSIEAIEANKTLATVENICAAIARSSAGNAPQIIAIGGGVIQDLTTLVASIYKRGIDWVYLPTTLAGMLDSCVGGKSSINVNGVKNLVGNIYPPRRVLIDTNYVSTLGKERIIDGLSEGVKIAFARGDETFLEFLANPSSSEPRPGEKLQALVQTTLLAKKWFVEIDEMDKKERRLLNFGHTFGHAVESASEFSISHGIAVSLGMLASIHFSGKKEVDKVQKLHNFCVDLLRPVYDSIAPHLVEFNWSEFRRLISLDKKNTEGKIHIIMPNEKGRLVENRFKNSDETLFKLENSLKCAFDEVRL